MNKVFLTLEEYHDLIGKKTIDPAITYYIYDPKTNYSNGLANVKYLSIDEYTELSLSGKINKDITYIIVDPYEYWIDEISWETIEVRDYESLSPHKWGDFHLADYISDTNLSTRGIVVVSSGVNFNQRTNLSTRGLAVVKSYINLRQATNLIIMVTMSKEDYTDKMLDYLPWYEKESDVYRNILKSGSYELRRLDHNLEIAEDNTWIDTAVEGLPIYERDFRMTPKNKYDYLFRRNVIMGRWQMLNTQITEEEIKNTIRLLSNNTAEIEIAEVSKGRYKVTFVGQIGIPPDMDLIKEAFKIAWPAHLGYNWDYRYTTWEDLKDTTWEEASVKTWETVRTWEEMIQTL